MYELGFKLNLHKCALIPKTVDEKPIYMTFLLFQHLLSAQKGVLHT